MTAHLEGSAPSIENLSWPCEDGTSELADCRQAFEAVAVAAAGVTQARVRLEDKIRQARALGVTWEAIGRATGMSRQSAHQRWSAAAAAAEAPAP